MYNQLNKRIVEQKWKFLFWSVKVTEAHAVNTVVVLWKLSPIISLTKPELYYDQVEQTLIDVAVSRRAKTDGGIHRVR